MKKNKKKPIWKEGKKTKVGGKTKKTGAVFS
jgi:hypothetical protein